MARVSDKALAGLCEPMGANAPGWVRDVLLDLRDCRAELAAVRMEAATTIGDLKREIQERIEDQQAHAVRMQRRLDEAVALARAADEALMSMESSPHRIGGKE